MQIPSDPNMLLGFINMKLRDGEYDSFEDACASLDIDKNQLVGKLKAAGFEYDPDGKRFW